VREGPRVHRVQPQVVAVREQPGGRRLAGAWCAADPEDVVD